MANSAIPHFHNTAGHKLIEIGVKEFMCIGAHPPFDHPHVFLDMGSGIEVICPYCSTFYKFNPKISAFETIPAGCLIEAIAA